MLASSRILAVLMIGGSLGCGRVVGTTNPDNSTGTVQETLTAHDSGNLDSRAVKYAAVGRRAAAEFFRRSAALARGQRWRGEQPLPDDALCDPSTPPIQISSAADQVQMMVNEGRYDDAIEAVRTASASDPNCGWQVQLADLTRLKSMIDPSSVDEQQRHDAIGILIASGQSGVLPLGAVGRSSVFFSLGQYFEIHGERSSAIAAYSLARDVLEADGMPNAVRDGMNDSIEKALRRLNP